MERAVRTDARDCGAAPPRRAFMFIIDHLKLFVNRSGGVPREVQCQFTRQIKGPDETARNIRFAGSAAGRSSRVGLYDT